MGSVTFLLLLAIPCSGDLSINMIPEVFDVPEDKTGTLFGASVTIESGSIFVASPYWSESESRVFECEIGEDKCEQGSIAAALGMQFVIFNSVT